TWAGVLAPPGRPGGHQPARGAQPSGAPSPHSDGLHAALPQREPTAPTRPRDRGVALDRCLLRSLPGGACGAHGGRAASAAGDVPTRVSTGLDRQVVRDPNGPPALVAPG